MKSRSLALAGVFLALANAMLPPSTANGQTVLSGGALRVEVSATGRITALRNAERGADYLAADSTTALLTLVSNGRRYQPTSLNVTRARQAIQLRLRFAEPGAQVVIEAKEHPTHLTLRVLSATPASMVHAIVWGPYRTSIGKTIGEIIGVVRDERVAVGLQVLNMKTLGGGLPNSEGSTWARGIAAERTSSGSVLQAYAINRDRVRTVDAWGGVYKNMPVPPIPGETVVGSAIALFSCAEPATLERLERIAVAEQLPRPTVDGVWFPKSKLFGRSYLISSFGEAEADEMIGFTRRAGLYSLYHEGPFKSWGHFVLDSAQFPNGREGMQRIVQKARAAGLHLGVHTLTNFINTNDPYVTPVPDDRLSVTGSSVLTKAIDATTGAIEVASPEYFDVEKENNLHTVKIGKELIQYRTVTATSPFVLLDAQRGAFGTTASAHAAGTAVGKLFDHPYKVLFPNFVMQREVAGKLVDFLNETGVDHIDFDGHEGALASGQGDYALAVFAKDVLDGVKHDLINGTSISKTFYWHIGSYYNWGEPWYGGFNESMQQYRIDNQALFDRNYMPHMLGWYLLTETTTLSEMEWMLARAAGYQAGFAMVARPKALRSNAQAGQLLDAIREWEDARTSGAFDSAQLAKLKDPANEFHLERVGDGQWRLGHYTLTAPFTRERIERQPGEPNSTTWSVPFNFAEQPVQFRIQVVGTQGAARNLVLQVGRYPAIRLPLELLAGESVTSDGSARLQVFDAQGKRKTTLQLPASPPTLPAGTLQVTMDSEFVGDVPPKIVVHFKGVSRTDTVRRRP